MPPEMTVQHNSDSRTYDAIVGGQVVGTVVYESKGSMVVISHTVVEPDYRRQGIASELVREALDDIRERRMTVSNYCGFIASFIEAHPEYGDLIDAVHPGVIVHP